MDKLINRNIIYAALDDTLRQLGFRVALHDTHRLYEGSNGAVVVIPQHIDMEDQVRSVHFLTARRTITQTGITDEATFEELLLKSASADLLTATDHAARSMTSAGR